LRVGLTSALFFESPGILNRLFPQYDHQFFLMFAKTSPKQALEFLFKNGGGPKNLAELLGSLIPDDIEQLRLIYPLNRLVTFVTDVSQAELSVRK